MRRRWLWILVDVSVAGLVLFALGTAAWRRFDGTRRAGARDTTAPAQPSARARSPQRAHLDRAYELCRSDRWKESLVYFDAALDLDPHDAEAAYFRGVARARTGAVDLALADFVRVTELDPDRIEAYRQVDAILFRRADWSGIVGHWSRYIERHPDSGDAWCERAGARKRGGDLEAALADARRSCELGWSVCCGYVRRTPAAR